MRINLKTIQAVLATAFVVSAFAHVVFDKPSDADKPSNAVEIDSRSSYRWCRVGEQPSRDKCVDGGGSGA
ncbi:MAG: hypothetical protein HC773_00860 [Scytonema sp. CRU_2_7]|nr:hypothetical protein [Scytonema sp. CRU_2_7]